LKEIPDLQTYHKDLAISKEMLMVMITDLESQKDRIRSNIKGMHDELNKQKFGKKLIQNMESASSTSVNPEEFQAEEEEQKP
jgi:chaperonin cofactor prefoldin